MTLRKDEFITWALRIIPSVIMLQTLYFKFSGAPESIYIFSQLGVEPWGRILAGIMEAIASILLLIPLTTTFGALIAMGIMGGAILSHIFKLGISVQGDGGLLFIYALIVFICSLILVLRNKKELIKYLPQK